MKIRIKGNSIRLRLTRSEVDQFGQTGIVSETTSTGNAVFGYALKNQQQPDMTAQFEQSIITVYMPANWAEEWTATERVGYETKMPLPGGDVLYLLVEKDFVCLDNTTEDQSDNYPNPLAEFHK